MTCLFSILAFMTMHVLDRKFSKSLRIAGNSYELSEVYIRTNYKCQRKLVSHFYCHLFKKKKMHVLRKVVVQALVEKLKGKSVFVSMDVQNVQYLKICVSWATVLR